MPAAALNRTRGHTAQLMNVSDFAGNPQAAEYYCRAADAIVIQRGAMPPAWDSVRRWQARGKLVLADIDDGYPQLPPHHPAYDFWHRGIVQGPNGQPQTMPRPMIYDMRDGLTVVDGLVSPSKLILADWQQTLPGLQVAWVPNYPPLAAYNVKRTRSPRDDGTTWVSWGGSAGHLQSFADTGIVYALARVLSSRPTARFVYVGSDLRGYGAVPLRASQKLHFNWRRYAEWPQILANFDVGLVPAAGEFDARRSWIKPLEYSLLGIPWIASKCPAYEGLEDYGTFVDNTPDAWAAALADLLDNGPWLDRVHRARLWALSQDISLHVDDIVKAYKSIKPTVKERDYGLAVVNDPAH